MFCDRPIFSGAPRTVPSPSAELAAHAPAYLRVTYDAGYGDTADDVDEALRHAILMTVARLYDDRGVVLNQVFREDPMIQGLFSNFRVWSA